jgi:hypothetical protein
MQQITVKDIDRLIEEINTFMETDTYELSGAYGGYQLHQRLEGGGARTLLSAGHVPKRELYGLLRAYIVGIEEACKFINKVNAVFDRLHGEKPLGVPTSIRTEQKARELGIPWAQAKR